MGPPDPRNPNTICRFYLPMAHNPACEAEVDYRDLQTKLDLKPLGLVAVCMGRAAGCSKYKPYTNNEIDAQDNAQKERSANIAVARKAIVEKTCGKRNVWGEIMPCPVCAVGVLKYSVSMWSGHVRGKCTTPTCVDWNE
jgi:hypothetical protein